MYWLCRKRFINVFFLYEVVDVFYIHNNMSYFFIHPCFFMSLCERFYIYLYFKIFTEFKQHNVEGAACVVGRHGWSCSTHCLCHPLTHTDPHFLLRPFTFLPQHFLTDNLASLFFKHMDSWGRKGVFISKLEGRARYSKRRHGSVVDVLICDWRAAALCQSVVDQDYGLYVSIASRTLTDIGNRWKLNG